jgi:Domain of unknown function (DUF4157)
VQPAAPVRPQALQPILPSQAVPSAVQPRLDGGFPLPANFALKPRGSGRPLPEPIQKKMEAFFNASFADVRVHVGHEASSIGALAFTHGTDLYFAPGQYNPESTPGQQLLGHELTHVVQQRAGRVRNPLGSGIAVVQDPALEAEAERMGLRAASFVRPIQAKPAAFGPGGAPFPSASPRPSTVAANGAILPARSLPQIVAQCKLGPMLPGGTSRAGKTARDTLSAGGFRISPYGSRRSSVLQAQITEKVKTALAGLAQDRLSKESIIEALETQFGSRSALHAATKEPEFSGALLEEIRGKQHTKWKDATKMHSVSGPGAPTWKSEAEKSKWNVRHYTSKFYVTLGAKADNTYGIYKIATVEPPPFTDILSSITIATFPTANAAAANTPLGTGSRVMMTYSSSASSSGHTTGIDWSNIGNVGDTFYGLFYGDDTATGAVPGFITDAVFYEQWPVANSGTDWWASADWLKVADKSHLEDTALPSGKSRTGRLEDIIADIFPDAAKRISEDDTERTRRRSAFFTMPNFEVKKHGPMHVTAWKPVATNVNKIKTNWYIDVDGAEPKFYTSKVKLDTVLQQRKLAAEQAVEEARQKAIEERKKKAAEERAKKQQQKVT